MGDEIHQEDGEEYLVHRYTIEYFIAKIQIKMGCAGAVSRKIFIFKPVIISPSF